MNHSEMVLIHGALCVQRGTPMLQGFASAATVSEVQAVDTYNPDSRTGYQRDPVQTRVRKAAVYYQNGGRMPNPLLANIRPDDFERVGVIVDHDRGGYDRALREGGNWVGSGLLKLPPDIKIWIYDGQHRQGGLRQLLKEQEEESSMAGFPVPLSVTLGLSQGEEMREFYEVNTNAMSVKTDLAWQLLTKMAEDDPKLGELLAVEGKDWVTRAYAVVDELAGLDGPWKGKFQEANKRKVKGDGVTIPKPAFARSLKPILELGKFKRAESAKIALVINAYWNGIKVVMPEPFDFPSDFVLQKAAGAVALHRVFPQVIDVVDAQGSRHNDADAYAVVMKELPTLEGEVVDGQGTPMVRSGADFWRVGSVASSLSGDAGRRRLALLIQTRLPSAADTLRL
ncbi:DGQHR domain-containing protein [Streptomyces sp. NPDC000594]|uniref:DGQHR domain-containing protein n=1 Tax=Streptomyces sp. NPDC000594 TaxID=3154261 RepID=UPI003316C33C